MSPPPTPRQGSGTARIVLVRLASAGAAFGLQLVLARLMSPTDFGSLVVVMTWIGLGAALGSLSMPMVAMRFIADYVARGALGAAKAVWRQSLAWVLLGGLSVAALMLLAAALGGLHLPGLAVADWTAVALLAVGGPVLALAAGQLQGLQRVVAAELLSNLMRTGLILAAAVVLAIGFGRRPGVPHLLWIHVGATLCAAIACWTWGRAARPAGWREATPVHESQRWRESAGGFVGVMLIGALAERVDVLVMGRVGSAPEVALYAVATRFSQAVAVLLVAVYGGLAPRVAAHLSDIQAGHLAATQADLSRFARVGALLAAGVAVVFGLLGPSLLTLFGAAYRDAAPALAVLGAGFALACLFGPGLLVVTLTGRAALAMAALGLGVLANVLLVAWLAPHWGALGAALGAAFGTVLPPALGWWWLRQSVGLDAAVWARPASAQ